MVTQTTRLEYFNSADIQIHTGPCRLRSVTLVGHKQTGECDIFNSTGQSESERIHLEADTGTTEIWIAQEPDGTYFDIGIYLCCRSGARPVMIEYIPIE